MTKADFEKMFFAAFCRYYEAEEGSPAEYTAESVNPQEATPDRKRPRQQPPPMKGK